MKGSYTYNNILTEEEKTALYLQIGLDKSTWEVGEIVKKAHYKYLEIIQRAKHFVSKFDPFVNRYGEVIPGGVRIEEDLKEYLFMLLVQRKSIKHAAHSMEDLKWTVAKERARILTEHLVIWRGSTKPAEMDLFNLLTEFDRYNNFRILPTEFQQPHAFKRRHKNKQKKVIKQALTLNERTVRVIVDKYQYHGTPTDSTLYAGLVLNLSEEDFTIIPCVSDPVTRKKFSRLGIYLFKTPELATEFTELVVDYFSKEKHHCIEGQKFWPEFREMIREAVNFKDIENASPYQASFKRAAKSL